MRLRFFFFTFAFITGASILSYAHEGMWLPMLINKYNYADMQKAGCKLTASQIYNINQACIKDAIVALDHGECSGSIISDQGLLITNHHCGYEAIQQHSTVDKDLLTQGFWATRLQEELPIENKTISFLVRMEDVTSKVLAEVTPNMNESDRSEKITKAIKKITDENETGNGLEASVESMFEGNEYYLFIYKTYRDIRLVGAPPSSIGKFGGETDNWMWPRHTGDFCLMRVYGSSTGEPADYSKDNAPIKPKSFLPISLNGFKEGDFAMIMGYPGSTDRYLTSYGIKQKLEQLNPAEIKMKTAKMAVMKAFMDKNEALQIAYASDYAYLANFQKKAIQESKALEHLKVYDDKKNLEDTFAQWVKASPDRITKYGTVLSDLEKVYKEKMEEHTDETATYIIETLTGAGILYLAYQMNPLMDAIGDKIKQKEEIDKFRSKVEEHFKSYNTEVDKELMVTVLNLFKENVPQVYMPDFYKTINRKYKGDTRKFVESLYKNSVLSTHEKLEAFMDNPNKKKLSRDPAIKTANSLLSSYLLIHFAEMPQADTFSRARRLFIDGLCQMNPDGDYYADANSTMRLTYGDIKAYKPYDAVSYDYRTTLSGVMEKEIPNDQEFSVPAKLKQLYEHKDFGQYAEHNDIPVCFLATLDITGGNSGSAVMNSQGELIGVAFDGNSEAMSSDIKYDEQLQRTICVDIRYVLYVIDKFAGAGYLLNELKIDKGAQASNIN